MHLLHSARVIVPIFQVVFLDEHLPDPQISQLVWDVFDWFWQD